MENNNLNNFINEYKKFCSSILEYEKYLKDIYAHLNNSNIPHRGYLIDLKEFEKLKEELNYQLYNKNIYDYADEIRLKLGLLFSKNKTYNLKKIEKIEIFSSDIFLNMLDNKNEYIIINTNLWRVLCKEGKENDNPFIYYLNQSELFFILEDNSVIHFHHNKNILNKQSYKYHENTNKINLIFFYFFFIIH